jgi:hypothetical protein
VPVLVIHAEDDPFMPGERAPLDAIRLNRAFEPVVTRRGGHVGFIAGSPWAAQYWAEREAAEYLAGRLHAVLDTGNCPA